MHLHQIFRLQWERYFTFSILTVILISASNDVCFSQSTTPPTDSISLPKVFILGEYENAHKQLETQYELLYQVCKGDMSLAFNKWLEMIKDMEQFSLTKNYNIGGVKAWIQIFFNADGTIAHLGFYLKSDSKNVSIDRMKSFFEDFINQYKFPLSSDKKFMHYTTISFPVFSY